MMVLLINKSDIKEFFQVAQGASVIDVSKYIQEAQNFDLKKLMCDDFYYDMLNRVNEPSFQRLIHGGQYEVNGIRREFQGLRKVIAYFAYARFILKSPIVSTSHGFVIKKTPNSEPLSLEERRNFYYQYRTDANALFEDVKQYIKTKLDDFPLWDNCNPCNKEKITNFKTRVLQ